MIDFWNHRYGETDFAYGKLPNAFLAAYLPRFEKGRLLFPAEGEGRNAVFAAQLGHQAYAFDTSIEAKNKAILLAAELDVQINYDLGHFADQKYHSHFFDGLVLIYAHFPKAGRATLHSQIIDCLKPGGFVIFEAFAQDQIRFSSGGPKDIEMLFSVDEIKNEFNALSFELLEKAEIDLREGMYHYGPASVIRFIGYKK